MNQLPGKVFKKILIIGSSSFLGKNLVKDFVHNNLVIGIDKNTKAKNNLKNFIQFNCDVNNEKKLSKIRNKILKKYKNIDIIINCFVEQNYRQFEKQNLQSFKKSLVTNVCGIFSVTKIFFKILKKSKNAQIINLGSIYGTISGDPKIYPDNKVTSDVYAASKAAIIQLTKYYSVHLSKYKIRVNCVSPGGIFNFQNKKFIKNYKKKVPLKRMAKVKEIVGCIKYLTNEDCNYINGHNLIVDGGFTVW